MEQDHLIPMLNRLKLTAICDQLDSLVDETARRELTIREALSLFCEREIGRKDERRIEMSIGLARFPFARSRRLRLRRPALDRQEADPRDRGRALHRQCRGGAAVGAARGRQDASGSGDQPPGNPGRLYGVVRAGADFGCPARQSA